MRFYIPAEPTFSTQMCIYVRLSQSFARILAWSTLCTATQAYNRKRTPSLYMGEYILAIRVWRAWCRRVVLRNWQRTDCDSQTFKPAGTSNSRLAFGWRLVKLGGNFRGVGDTLHEEVRCQSRLASRSTTPTCKGNGAHSEEPTLSVVRPRKLHSSGAGVPTGRTAECIWLRLFPRLVEWLVSS